MEMLMARAEQERSGLERELRAMRYTASEAASHLHLAEEELRVSPCTWCILSKACLVHPERSSCPLRSANPGLCMQSVSGLGVLFHLACQVGNPQS